MKKITAFLIAIFCLCGFASAADGISTEMPSVNAAAQVSASAQSLDIKAKSAILIEPNTGKVLYEQNPDERLPPASITKIMSLLLVEEALDRGDFTLETVVTASEHACGMGGSQIWLEPNEAMTVNDLLKATVIASANDACVALGELVSGSEEGFVAAMNKRADELGMTQTEFVNCTGLDADGHLTTARDISLMAAELIRHKQITDYTTVWMDSLRDGKSELVNTNRLIRFYEGATGLKTGTTSAAKYCICATARRDGMELVAVVLAGESSQERFNAAKKLLDHGFANYSYSTLSADIAPGTAVAVKRGTKKSVKVTQGEKLCILLPKSANSEIEQQISLSDTVTAPVKAGDRLGTATLTANGEMLGEIPLIACESVKQLSFSYALTAIIKGLFIF